MLIVSVVEKKGKRIFLSSAFYLLSAVERERVECHCHTYFSTTPSRQLGFALSQIGQAKAAEP